MPRLKAEPKKEKPIIYYCMKGSFTFHLPEFERDAAGDIIYKDTEKLRPLIKYETDVDGNNKKRIEKKFAFDRLTVIDEKTHKPDASKRRGIFVLSPEYPDRWERKDEIIKIIEEAKRFAVNGLKTEDEYKKEENSLAFSFSKENDALKDRLGEAEKRIAELEEQLTKPRV
jgi:hypothetical protein